MKIKLLILVSASFLSYENSFAQKNIEPNSEEIVKAKQLKSKYEKDEIAILESKEKVRFELPKNSQKVAVIHSINEKLMNITPRANIHKYEFYDSESKIESFSIKYKNDKTANFPVTDEFYKDKDLFYHDAKVKYAAVNFPTEGYIYKYEMSKRIEDSKYFTTIYFNDEFPSLEKEIEIVVPSWLTIEIKEFNFNGYQITKTITKDKDNNTVYKYIAKETIAFSSEKNTPGKSYIYPHLLLLTKSFSKDGKQVTLFNKVDDLYKWYKSLVDLLKDNPDAFKAKVNELVKDAKTEEDKIKKIYYWVQDNIRYIAFEDGIAGFKPDESHQVFEKRYGDCKGMANLIKQMLKSQGFDTRLTWIGTKHLNYNYEIPSLIVDNHMICTLIYKGKRYFLDGTEKFNSFGDYAERIQGKEVLIENGDQFIIDKIPVFTSDHNLESSLIKVKVENEKLIGKGLKTCKGESKSKLLYLYSSFPSDKKQEYLLNYISDNDKNKKIKNLKNSDFTNRDNDAEMTYDIEIANKVSQFDNEMYIDFEFINEFKQFNLKDRKIDFEFDYKTNLDSTIEFEIPAGYTIKKKPENLIINEPDYFISLSFEVKNNIIYYKKNFNFKNGILRSKDFQKWTENHNRLLKTYNQQIILSKN